ncbi:MAG TPA: toxin-antitoxin system HicB family antitoxin [Pirellulales bacterium]|nr:toxin-antitoxin system HicB family antitoxin [Pirellulales bacterium]
MAKQSSNSGKNSSDSDRRAVFQVRLDADVHRRLKEAAGQGGISLNQLIQGVLRWAAANVRQGRPRMNNGEILSEPASECVWFGHPTTKPGIGIAEHPGQFVFALNYSDSKALEEYMSDDP